MQKYIRAVHFTEKSEGESLRSINKLWNNRFRSEIVIVKNYSGCDCG